MRISIHALRVEGDDDDLLAADLHQISIHALRVEGDLSMILSQNSAGGFLSTPSGWRATNYSVRRAYHFRFLSTPSGWRATRDNEAAAF